MRVVFLGPPGSGKGTQAKLLASRLAVPAISTGEILRAAVSERKPLGVQAKAVMDTGELVSDELMVALIRDRTQQADAADGFILDGFPRTLAQAAALETMLAETGQSLSGVLNLSVPEPLLVDRMAGRAAADRAAPTTRRRPSVSACGCTARRPRPWWTLPEARPHRRRRRRGNGARGLQPNRRGAPERT